MQVAFGILRNMGELFEVPIGFLVLHIFLLNLGPGFCLLQLKSQPQATGKLGADSCFFQPRPGERALFTEPSSAFYQRATEPWEQRFPCGFQFKVKRLTFYQNCTAELAREGLWEQPQISNASDSLLFLRFRGFSRIDAFQFVLINNSHFKTRIIHCDAVQTINFHLLEMVLLVSFVRNLWVTQGWPQQFPSIFSLRSSVVWGFMLRSMSHFELIFVANMRLEARPTDCIWKFNDSITIGQKGDSPLNCLYPISKLAICVGLFQETLFFSVRLYIASSTNTILCRLL